MSGSAIAAPAGATSSSEANADGRRPTILAGGRTGAALMLSTGAAGATVVTADLNLRARPSVTYRVIATMAASSNVAVLIGRNGELREDRGYATQNFIAGRYYAVWRYYYYSSPHYPYYYSYNTASFFQQ